MFEPIKKLFQRTDQSVSASQTSDINEIAWEFDFKERMELMEDEELGSLIKEFELRLMDEPAHWRDLIQSENWQELKSKAHQLKGAAGGYGHSELGKLAADCEKMVKTETYASASEILGKFAYYINNLHLLSQDVMESNGQKH